MYASLMSRFGQSPVSISQCMKLSAFAAQTLSDVKGLDMNSLDLHRNIKHSSLSFRATHQESVKQGRRSMIPPRKFQTRSKVILKLYFGLSHITTLVSQDVLVRFSL